MDENFWKTVRIWSQKPHVVNKRLIGVATLASWKFVSSFSCWQDIVDKNAQLIGLNEDQVLEAISQMEWEKSGCWANEELSMNPSHCLVSLRKCLPKQPRRHQPVFELEFIDFKLNCAVYIPLQPNKESTDHLTLPCPYAITFSSNDPCIDVEPSQKKVNCEWLFNNVLPKLRKWYGEMDQQAASGTDSLQLVSLEAYNDLYQKLKGKYVQDITKIWPECTDPQKFIHEDVAIATYLILIWRKESKDLNLGDDYRQSFYDIGCGNGLLVYLLASEGYPGKGIDIRARKIWSFYPPQVKLEVSTLTPTETTAFLEYDWLLGNHSDELTPWLPVMALQSSVQRQPERLPTRFWVLPCCPFSFFSKFQREKFNASNNSRYHEYLRFVADVGRTCGFHVQEDRMRIPSTRRTCFVGSLDARSQSEWAVLLDAKSQLIAMSREGVPDTTFQPRPAVELVRNCTRVERSILDEIVHLTAKCLLAGGSQPEESGWNPGATVNFSDLMESIRKEFNDFQRLKNECGGIQTLLKNHSHIFVVQNQSVRFRSPEELSVDEWRAQLRNQNPTARKKLKSAEPPTREVKRRQCWFFIHHPNGCPLNTESCRYIHETVVV